MIEIIHRCGNVIWGSGGTCPTNTSPEKSLFRRFRAAKFVPYRNAMPCQPIRMFGTFLFTVRADGYTAASNVNMIDFDVSSYCWRDPFLILQQQVTIPAAKGHILLRISSAPVPPNNRCQHPRFATKKR